MSTAMASSELEQFLSREKDRYGNDRLYVRRNGKRIRIREKEGTSAFARAYVAAVEKLGAPPSRRPRGSELQAVTWSKDTFGWLANRYFASRGEGEFQSLEPESRRARRNDIEACLKAPRADGDADPMGNCPLKHLTAQKMKRLIEMKDGTGARANRRKHLSALCAWAVDQMPAYLPSNPVRDVKAGRQMKGGGYYTWAISDVQQFLDHHSGTTVKARKARLALGLLLFGGMRRQDMVDLGRQNCRGASPRELGDWIRYVPKKTRKIRREMSQKPLLPILKGMINSSSDILGDITFLVTMSGKPFTEAGFGNWFRDRCDEAGLPQCTAHGLKKAGATIAAENGATTRQLMAMFDWDSHAMAEVYTRAAERKRLAGEAMVLISLDRKENNDCLTSEGVGETLCRTV